ncbi:MAG: HNH endonuclease [Alphaproteobacteria bacterium]|nr:HNH endonuclease [Alphaproteobacteria bacterium]
MIPEYKLVHAKRSHKGGKSGTKVSYNAEQRAGRFNFDTIHGMKLKKVVYHVPSSDERKAKRAEFQGHDGKEGMRSKFLKMLAKDHEKQLRDQLGFTDAEINLMKQGRSVPGYNVHHKLPLHGGGKNEFSNFILTPLYPHDQWHHDVLDPQIADCMGTGQSKEVMLPWTDAMIYDPKQFGFTKDNAKVQPNYASRVNPNNYPKIYTAEQVADAANRKKELAKFAPPVQNGGRKNVALAVLNVAKQR